MASANWEGPCNGSQATKKYNRRYLDTLISARSDAEALVSGIAWTYTRGCVSTSSLQELVMFAPISSGGEIKNCYHSRMVLL